MSIVTVLQPPDYANDHFELCYAEGLGLIVFCKKCEVAVLAWDDKRMRWLEGPEQKSIKPHHSTYTIRCWASCGRLVHRPGIHIVRRYQEFHAHD